MYLSQATKEFQDCSDVAEKWSFNNIISSTIKKNRKYLGSYKSVKQIWENETSIEKATRLMSYLSEEQIVLEDLEEVLVELFEDDVNFLENCSMAERTNVKRLIMIYDCLKWRK